MITQKNTHDYLTKWGVILLTLIGFSLRLWRLETQNVWWDEGLASWSSRQSLEVISHWTAHDVHPPLYFWLLHFWRYFSGDTEFGLRLLSAFFGVLTIPATYLLGKQIDTPQTGFLAALLITISRFSISWSQEMRMYALVALLGTFALWAAIKIWENDKRWLGWLAYIVFMVAGLYTLYLFVMVLVTANLVWLFWVWPQEKFAKRNFWAWSLAQATILALYAPWLYFALGRIPTWSQATPLDFWTFVNIYWAVFTIGIPLDVNQFWILTIPLFVLFGLGATLVWWQQRTHLNQRRLLALLILGLLLPALIVYIISLPQVTFFYSPPIAPRYLIIFIAAYAVLFGWGLTFLAQRKFWFLGWLGIGFTIYVALFGLKDYHVSRNLNDDFYSLTATLMAYQHPSDAVVLYTDTDWPIFAHHYPQFWHGIPTSWQITAEQAHNFLNPIWEQQDGIWLVVTQYAFISDPQQWILQWLDERALGQKKFQYGNKQLIFFARTAERANLLNTLQIEPPPHQEPLLALPDNLILQNYDLQTKYFTSGDMLHLFLYWQGNSPIPYVLGLADTAETLYPLAPLTAEPPRQQIDLLLNTDLPTNTYRFYLAPEATPDTPLLFFGQINLVQKQNPFVQIEDISIQNASENLFEQGIKLLGYDLSSTTLHAGEAIPLTLYWESAGATSQPYKVFTHVMGEVYNINTNNFLWGQQDNEPQNGLRPTTSWRAEEIIIDSYTIPLDPQTPPGLYQIAIGFYDPLTGQRLLLNDQTDHVILTTIRVVAP